MNKIWKQGHIQICYLDQMDQPEPLQEIILADEWQAWRFKSSSEERKQT